MRDGPEPRDLPGVPESLPLFPLGGVLFPGVPLPLHVFEPRYRVLVRELLDLPEGSAREFGVIAIQSGHEVGEHSVRGVDAMHEVGCIARLRQVTALEDGRFELVAIGTTRFRLAALAAVDTPYLTGVVHRLEEPDGDGVDALARAVVGRFQAYRDRLGVVGELTGDIDPGSLSYLVASAMLLEIREQQALLEQPDTAGRLGFELALLRRENALVDALAAVPARELTRAPFALN